MSFSKKDLYSLHALFERVDQATTISEIKESIKLIDNLVEIDSSICTAIELTAKGIKTLSAMVRFPSQWVSHYIKKNYASIDPVAQIAMSHPGVVHQWEDAFAQRLAPKVFMHESQEFGLKNGVVMGYQTEEFLTQYSVVANKKTKREREQLEGLVWLVTPKLHSAMRRVLSNPLSPREIEVLRLISKGYTNREVAEALEPKVSYDTVLQHVKNIKRKLGANNIQHAVFLAGKAEYLK